MSQGLKNLLSIPRMKEPSKAMNEKALNPLDGVQALAQMAQVLRDFGVVGGVEHLLDPSVRPESCMKDARNSLHFMGFGARKWRQEPWFAEHLTRLHRRDGEVHFLIGKDASSEARDALANSMHRFPGTFEARVMAERSLFRLVIIDRRKMVLSHYGHEVIMEDGTNAMGWQSPQLLIEQGPEWSLIIPFTMYYSDIWNKSEPVAHIESISIEADRRRRGFA
jgi:hypothetical protein